MSSSLIIDNIPIPDIYSVYTNSLQLGELKLKNGTYVEIKSTKTKDSIYAPLFANSVCEYGFIQIGRALRLNLKCRLGENVIIKQIKKCPTANCVVFSPISDTVENIEGKYSDLLLNSEIINKISIIRKNQIIPIKIFNRIIEFKAVIVQPADVVIVDRKEVFACRNMPVERKGLPKFDGICYDDIGGLCKELLKIRQVIEVPLVQPKLFLENSKIKNILIIGKAGTGKSFLMESIKNETFAFCKILDCYNLFTKTTEKAIIKLLKSIKECVFNQPSIIIFDNIDIIASPNVSKDGDSDPRLFGSIISAIKRLKYEENLVTIATARNISILGKTFSNYFDKTIDLVYPDNNQRFAILRAVTNKMFLVNNYNIDRLVIETDGYTPSQIEMYCNELMLTSIAKVIENHKKKDHKFNITELNNIVIKKDDDEYNEKLQKRNLYNEFDSFLEIVEPIESNVKNNIKIKNYFDNDLSSSDKDTKSNIFKSDNENNQLEAFEKIKGLKSEKIQNRKKDPFGLLFNTKHENQKLNIENYSDIKKYDSEVKSESSDKIDSSKVKKEKKKNPFQKHINSSSEEEELKDKE